jgi:hypothetical protein
MELCWVVAQILVDDAQALLACEAAPRKTIELLLWSMACISEN